jgi:ubiquitin thioesterase OTU1
MNILSRYFSVEIAAIDIQTRNFYIYGAGGGGDIKRIYLIYDGIHYDPMVYERKSGDLVTKFSPSDDSVMKQVQRVAQELFESRSFTDGATYTLRCMVCNEGIVGNDGAIAHGTKTGHTNFREY